MSTQTGSSGLNGDPRAVYSVNDNLPSGLGQSLYLDNAQVAYTVTSNTWYPIKPTELLNKVIRLEGVISGGAVNMQIPAGVTGTWFIDNQTTTTDNSAINWGVVGNSGLAWLAAGTSAWLVVSISGSTAVPEIIYLMEPATGTVLGGVIVKDGLAVASDGSLSAHVTSVAGRTGAIVLAVGDVSGAAPLATPTFAGPVNITEAGTDAALYITSDAGAWQSITLDSSTNANGSNIKFVGNGSTTPAKYVGAYAGKLQIVNDAHTAAVVTIDDGGNVVSLGTITANSLTALGTVTASSLVSSSTSTIGSKGSAQELDIGMNSTVARLRERGTVDDFTIATNVDISGNQDNVGGSSWTLSLGSGTDRFAVGRMPAGSTGVPNPPSMLAIDKDGQITAQADYVPTQVKSLVTKDYVDGLSPSLPIASAGTLGGIRTGTGLSTDPNDGTTSTTYVGTKYWVCSSWVTTQWTQMIPYGLNYAAGAPGFQFITESAPSQDMVISFGLVSAGNGSFSAPTSMGSIRIPAFSVQPDTSQFFGQQNTAVGTLLVVSCNLTQPFSFCIPTTVWTSV